MFSIRIYNEFRQRELPWIRITRRPAKHAPNARCSGRVQLGRGLPVSGTKSTGLKFTDHRFLCIPHHHDSTINTDRNEALEFTFGALAVNE